LKDIQVVFMMGLHETRRKVAFSVSFNHRDISLPGMQYNAAADRLVETVVVHVVLHAMPSGNVQYAAW
jgi:hypothetical protein